MVRTLDDNNIIINKNIKFQETIENSQNRISDNLNTLKLKLYSIFASNKNLNLKSSQYTTQVANDNINDNNPNYSSALKISEIINNFNNNNKQSTAKVPHLSLSISVDNKSSPNDNNQLSNSNKQFDTFYDKENSVNNIRQNKNIFNLNVKNRIFVQNKNEKSDFSVGKPVPFKLENLKLKEQNMPTLPYFYLSTTSTIKSNIYSANNLNEIHYRNNEMYSIFVSMLTAALFLLFIMWRWIRIKSDLRKALREQSEIDQQLAANNSEQNRSLNSNNPCSSSSSRFHSILANHNYNSYLTNKENLEALINQLSLGPNRDLRHNQQILNAAKYCLNQLRRQARANREIDRIRERDYLSNYFTYSNRYDRTLFQNPGYDSRNSTQTNSPSSNSPPFTDFVHAISTTSSTSSLSEAQSSIFNFFNTNELPPSYESLMTKSSSLPSYYNVDKSIRKE